MRDGDFRVRSTEISACAVALVVALASMFVLAACGTSKSAPASSGSSGGTAAASTAANVSAPMLGAAPGSACPATGLWAECSVLYRLDRAGAAPHLDSAAVAAEPALSVKGIRIKIGLSAQLAVFLYPDSAARVADAAHLDRSQFVAGDTPQTMKRERTLIQSANLLALLTSINDAQRERVADALTAGPPQPNASPIRSAK